MTPAVLGPGTRATTIVRVVLAVLEVHDLVRDALARVLPTAGAEVILLGSNASIDTSL